MNGKLNSTGVLQIGRAGTLRSMFCPFTSEKCGDWCPLFGEPLPIEGTYGAIIELCHTTLQLEEFTDERTAAEPDPHLTLVK